MVKAYKMKINAELGYTENLLSDLRWIERKCDVLNPDGQEWIRITRNIIYENWIPQLWTKKDYATAVLLAAYADNLEYLHKRLVVWGRGEEGYWDKYESMSISRMRQREDVFNNLDYSSLSFQMMERLTSSQLASTYKLMMGDSPLYKFLRRNIRCDRDYYYELIGTLALREENYPRAIYYLSKVSNRYLRTMNIYKEGYLNRDPFDSFPVDWKEFSGDFFDRDWEKNRSAVIESKECAKLKFALRMLKYKTMMSNGKTGDERGWGRMMYATGCDRSFGRCWALTEYSSGYCSNMFYPALVYWTDDFAEDKYKFLTDYEPCYDPSVYDREILAAIEMMETPEIKAKAEYFLGNLVTVVKKYPETSAANFVKTSCDNWKEWL